MKLKSVLGTLFAGAVVATATTLGTATNAYAHTSARSLCGSSMSHVATVPLKTLGGTVGNSRLHVYRTKLPGRGSYRYCAVNQHTGNLAGKARLTSVRMSDFANSVADYGNQTYAGPLRKTSNDGLCLTAWASLQDAGRVYNATWKAPCPRF